MTKTHHDATKNKSIDPRKKNVTVKNYRNNSSNIDLKHLQACLNASIEVAKKT